jgi:hypothetical protein
MIFAVVLVGAIVADDKGIAVTRHEERVAGAISNADPNAQQAPVGANGNTEAAHNATPAPDSTAEVVQLAAGAESSVVRRITDCVRFAVPTGDQMAPRQRSDRLRGDLYAGGLRKRVVD